MLLMIDNYDSFTYNLVQYLGELGEELTVCRNDAVSLDEIRELDPEFVVFSPGPRTPREAGVTVEVIRALAGKKPMLGVCLGHQAIGYAFGGEIVRAPRIMHGKSSLIYHNGQDLFSEIPQPFSAVRYHSLVIDPASLPDCLICTARTSEGEIMGVRHREYPVFGVQFHPESVLSEHGKQLLTNFLAAGRMS